jgi:bifunctional ADP-heptose synthase (sugar kinase/adenylyltransferase)
MTRAFLSRETPRFPRPVPREMYSAGAGANMVHNLQVMGVGRVVVLSVLGEDWRGRILSNVLAAGADFIVTGFSHHEDLLAMSTDR